MRLLLLATFLVALTGCSLTKEELAQLNQMMDSANQSVQQTNRNMTPQVYNSTPPPAYVPPVNTGESHNFMFNTPDGIEQKTCRKTNSNYVYCY